MPTHDEALRALDEFPAFTATERAAAATLCAYIEQTKADAVDAGRYRALRDPAFHEGNPHIATADYETGEQLDAAIDAAIAARSAKPGEMR